MEYCPTTNIIQPLITHILTRIDQQIDLLSLLAFLPQFASRQILTIVSEMSNLAAFQSPGERMFAEETLGDIPKLEKDTLMPKDLSQEKGRAQSPKKSPRSSASSMRKLAFKKRQSSQLVEQLHSISITQKRQSKQVKKSQKPPLYPLPYDQPATQQHLDGLRNKTETRLQYYQQQNKLKQEREQIFQSKLNELNSILQEDPKTNITYDYQGDALRSNIADHENLKIVMTKTGIGFANRRAKDGFRNLVPQQSKVQVRGRIVKSLKEEGSGAVRPSELPMFQVKFPEENQVKNLKLQQYKKFYGKKYNRLDQRNHTIDMNQTTKTTKQDIFLDKKHLKDADPEQNSNPIPHPFPKAKSTNRKLALPKLNGKYKVLDRYQQ